MKYLLANWKQNMSISEVRNWIDVFISEVSQESLYRNKIIIAPSFIHLFELKKLLEEKGLVDRISIASQDVSSFEKGSHTGEIGAFQLKEIVKYAIIGHSERRSLGENLEMINKKIDVTIKCQINPVVCFSDKEEYKSIMTSNIRESNEALFLFEPLFAIGTGIPATVDDVISVHNDYANTDLIYGGSVDKINVVNYLSCSFVKGFGVGTASLDPLDFAGIANAI